MKIKLTEKSLDRVALPAKKPQVIVWDNEVLGFGVVVGRLGSTFVVNYRLGNVRRRQVIGKRGANREDGQPWNVTRAREEAREILGNVAATRDRERAREILGRVAAPGQPLREALRDVVREVIREELDARARA